MIRGNRLHSNGLDLSYTMPMIVDGEVEVHIEEQDIASEMKFLENAPNHVCDKGSCQ